MDIKPAITKIFEMFKSIDSAKQVNPGFGVKVEQLKSKGGTTALLFCIISPPTQKWKGKLKSYEKILKKNSENAKLIFPDSFPVILASCGLLSL